MTTRRPSPAAVAASVMDWDHDYTREEVAAIVGAAWDAIDATHSPFSRRETPEQPRVLPFSTPGLDRFDQDDPEPHITKRVK